MPCSTREGTFDGIWAAAMAQAMLSANAAIPGMSPTRKAMTRCGVTSNTTLVIWMRKPLRFWPRSLPWRAILRACWERPRGEGYLHGNGYVVTWAVGHLASLAQPHEIRPEWKAWRRDLLPMLPESWPLVVYEKTKDQFEIVRKILCSPRVASVICATDAGREGELIFRYIYEAAGCSKPVSRLWISSLTPEAIRRGFDAIRPGHDYDPLAEAARGRSRADWLVGLNLTRAYTIAYGDELSVGRVQTPTLAMVVERELAIRRFVPGDYREVVAEFRPTGRPEAESYKGTGVRDIGDIQKSARLAADGVEAVQIVARAR